MRLDTNNIPISPIVFPETTEKGITLAIARLDMLHPMISGNKFFKLFYFLEEAEKSSHKTILTFGGAFSNHLSATAHAGKLAGLNTIGIVRGEEPAILSPTLQQCLIDGMQLKFISREEYKSKTEEYFLKNLHIEFGNFILIPEGGFDSTGAKGAALIQNSIQDFHATHLCVAVGTATTLAGLLLNNPQKTKIIAVPVIKNMTDIIERTESLIGKNTAEDLIIWNDYHLGGYAKKTPEQIQFMNEFYNQFHTPTDIIYTSKLMMAVMEQIKNGYFTTGDRVLCLHTGGLQGNTSLPIGTLIF